MVQPLEKVGLATLAPGATPIHGRNVTEVWRGPVYSESGLTVAFVKILPLNQLISESVCALLGRSIGLSIPTPMLVKVHRNVLPQSKIWNSGQSEIVVFGSESIGHPDFSQFLSNTPDKAGTAKKLLLGWKSHKTTAVFDEWMANDDRHLGNFLYDGTGCFWLIDHSHALTGHKWKASDLDPTVSKSNKLLEFLVEGISLHEKHQWKKAAMEQLLEYMAVDARALVTSECVSRFATAEEQTKLEAFIVKRVNEIIRLVCHKLGIQELAA